MVCGVYTRVMYACRVYLTDEFGSKQINRKVYIFIIIVDSEAGTVSG